MIFVGDDWAEAHHDVYVMDEAGVRLATRRLVEGLEGIRGFHELVAELVDEPAEVVVGIETDCGLWGHEPTRSFRRRTTRSSESGRRTPIAHNAPPPSDQIQASWIRQSIRAPQPAPTCRSGSSRKRQPSPGPLLDTEQDVPISDTRRSVRYRTDRVIWACDLSVCPLCTSAIGPENREANIELTGLSRSLAYWPMCP